jgi:hypothetical protein
MPLFDHLVGACMQSQRQLDAERLGSLEVKDQLDLYGLLNRQIGGFFTLENAANIAPNCSMLIREVCSIAHQAASGRKLAEAKDRRHLVLRSKIGKSFDVSEEK